MIAKESEYASSADILGMLGIESQPPTCFLWSEKANSIFTHGNLGVGVLQTLGQLQQSVSKWSSCCQEAHWVLLHALSECVQGGGLQHSLRDAQ